MAPPCSSWDTGSIVLSFKSINIWSVTDGISIFLFMLINIHYGCVTDGNGVQTEYLCVWDGKLI